MNVPTKPATLYQRVSIRHMASGHALVVLLRRDGTWRESFMMFNLKLQARGVI
jgi:hypothetical protein